MSDERLAKAVDRLTVAVERLAAAIAGSQLAPGDEPCSRCNGRGHWAPGVPCETCGGAGRQ